MAINVQGFLDVVNLTGFGITWETLLGMNVAPERFNRRKTHLSSFIHGLGVKM